MVLSLIFGKKYAQSKVGSVTFDTMISEEHKFTSRVTYFPVERGTIVSDHIINQPDIVILSGFITDTPLSFLAPFNRSIAAFNALIEIHNRREPVRIITGLKIYDNMAITSLDVPRTVKTGQTLTFNIELQKITYDDEIRVLNTPGNVFAGVSDNTPRTSVAENTNIPLLQNDPPFSLKDQATTATNVGAQSLQTIPTSVMPNVITSVTAIAGVM